MNKVYIRTEVHCSSLRVCRAHTNTIPLLYVIPMPDYNRNEHSSFNDKRSSTSTIIIISTLNLTNDVDKMCDQLMESEFILKSGAVIRPLNSFQNNYIYNPTFT